MFDRIRQIFSRKAIDDPWMMIAGGVGTAGGLVVSVETAMKCPTVFASTLVISEAVAQIPLILYERGAGDERNKAVDHPLYAVLRHQANDWTSAYNFRLDMQLDVLKHGAAFAFINRDRDGEIRELIQITFEAVKVKTDTRTMEPNYTVTDGDGKENPIPRDQILHLRGMGGLSPIKQCREAIGIALAMEEYLGRLFGRGARPAGVVETPNKIMNPETIKKLRASFDAAHGSGKSGGTLILEEGFKWRQISLSSTDAQFQELRRQQTADISRAFRVPLSLLNDLERITHANAEALGQQFLTFTILPWLKMWEGAIRLSLIAEDERKNFFAEFLTDDLARADLAARFAAYTQAVTNGILNPNEVRAMENRPPYATGDVFTRPLNTGTPERIKE